MHKDSAYKLKEKPKAPGYGTHDTGHLLVEAVGVALCGVSPGHVLGLDHGPCLGFITDVEQSIGG
jgi:hypothetical protein